MSSPTAESFSNRTLTADTFNNNKSIGNINGKASIDMSVALLLSDAEMTDTKVKTTDIPNIPNTEPEKNKL